MHDKGHIGDEHTIAEDLAVLAEFGILAVRVHDNEFVVDWQDGHDKMKVRRRFIRAIAKVLRSAKVLRTNGALAVGFLHAVFCALAEARLSGD